MRCALGVLLTLAGCLALQGCASLGQDTQDEFVQVNAADVPHGLPPNATLAVVAAPVVPTAPPANAIPSTTIPVSPVSKAASVPAPKPVPVPERAAIPESRWETLPLSLLQKEASPDYRLAPEDILGVWVGGVLGELNEPPPPRIAKSGSKPSGYGFPVPVRADGTILLPLVSPIQVAQMTVEEAEEAIRHAYTVGKEILKRGRERIVVTLMKQRECPVVVIRQDMPADAPAGVEATKRNGRGVVQTIGLPATENDVLHALALTGGYPRPEVPTEIIIERQSATGVATAERLPRSAKDASPGPQAESVPGDRRVCITLNYPSSYRPMVRPQDVVLHKGDVMVVRPIRLSSLALASAMAGK